MNKYDLLFESEGKHKEFIIGFDDGTIITNNELYQESFELTESICSEPQIKFGSCESSQCKFIVSYSDKKFNGKKFTVTIQIEDENYGTVLFLLGTYKVKSDTPTADRRRKEIIAYDAMHDILNADVTSWYNSLFVDDQTKISLKALRDGFFEYLSVEQEEIALPNDDINVIKNPNYKKVSGYDIVTALCELNGCFGHISRENKFTYVFISSPSEPIYPSLFLYPSKKLFPKPPTKPTEIGIQYRYKYPLPKIVYPDNGLYPEDEIYPEWYEYDTPLRGVYQYVDYKDYKVKQITGIQIRDEKNQLVCGIGRDNFYYIKNNFLLYNLSQETLNIIAERILQKIRNAYYTPSKIIAQGNPNILVGTPIVLHTKYAIIESIIFQRTLKGIQALKDTYYADGEETHTENLNGTEEKYNQINGEVNTVKSDLVQAKKVIAEEIAADRADIATIKANYVSVSQLEAVYAKVDQLSAIAITTQNLSSQTINGNQINAGTITADRLNVASFATTNLTVNSMTLKGILHCQFGGETNFGLQFVDVDNDLDVLKYKRVAYFYAE